MKLLLSGEGPRDLGTCKNSLAECNTLNSYGFEPGPLAIMVDQILEKEIDYSIFLIPGMVSYVGETAISQEKRKGRSLIIPGKKGIKDTAYFVKNAKRLGEKAGEMSKELGCPVVAILFRDADRTCTSPKSQWDDKYQSMCRGFKLSKHPHCVPMLPNPKSEAWLLCALKQDHYENCDKLESWSGNDAAKNNLKNRLDGAVSLEKVCTSNLVQWVQERRIDVERIDMKSFNYFREQLLYVLSLVLGGVLPGARNHCPP